MRTLSWLWISLRAGMPAITETAIFVVLYRNPKAVFYLVAAVASSSLHVVVGRMDTEGARYPFQLRSNFLPFRKRLGVELQVVDQFLKCLGAADGGLDSDLAFLRLLKVAEHGIGLLLEGGHQAFGILLLAGSADGALLKSFIEVLTKRFGILFQILHQCFHIVIVDAFLRMQNRSRRDAHYSGQYGNTAIKQRRMVFLHSVLLNP